MLKDYKRTLVLNIDYTPMGAISSKRAIIKLIISNYIHEEGCTLVENYKDAFVLSAGGLKFPIPAVIRTNRYIHKKRRKIVPLTHRNIFLRDNYTCQYCRYFDGTSRKLTCDHVISKYEWNKRGYKGTPNIWENVVTSCYDCNNKKGNRSLRSIKEMKLIRLPKKPKLGDYIPGLPLRSRIPDEWKKWCIK